MRNASTPPPALPFLPKQLGACKAADHIADTARRAAPQLALLRVEGHVVPEGRSRLLYDRLQRRLRAERIASLVEGGVEGLARVMVRVRVGIGVGVGVGVRVGSGLGLG